MDEEVNFFDIMFFIIGIFLIIFSIYLYFNTKSTIDSYVQTTGTLERLEENGRFILTFKTEDFRPVQVYSLYNNVLAKTRSNRTYTVYYDKENVDKVKIKSFISLWGVSTFTILVGLILLIISIIKLVKVKLAHGKEQHYIN